MLNIEYDPPMAVAAQPGWFVLSMSLLDLDDTAKCASFLETATTANVHVHLVPIIAWRIQFHHLKSPAGDAQHPWDGRTEDVSPITLDGIDPSDSVVIRSPDGQIMIPQRIDFDDENDAKSWFLENERDRAGSR
jgi:hypothetical protein